MKRIIDIDNKRIKGIKLLAKEQDIETPYPTLEQIIANGIPIPGNATNGDVVKTLFSNTLDNFCERTTWEWSRWWNAPYQKGGKE